MKIALLLLAASSFVAAQNDTTADTNQGTFYRDLEMQKSTQNNILQKIDIKKYIQDLRSIITFDPMTLANAPAQLLKIIKDCITANRSPNTTYVSDVDPYMLVGGHGGDFSGISSAPSTNQPNQLTYNYVDYRNQGIVTPPKDQGQCGSCYSFAATGLFECKCMNRTNKNEAACLRSEQQIIDCSHKRYEGKTQNQGCSRGTTTAALQYMNEIDTLSSKVYKYNGRQAWSCGANEQPSQMSFYVTTVDLVSEDHLAVLLNRFGPIVVYIYACNSFMTYKSGLYNDNWDSCGRGSLNHAVLIVGITSMGGKDVWIVKNSWGEKWGDKGFIYMQKGKNICQMMKAPAILLTDTPNPDTAPPA